MQVQQKNACHDNAVQNSDMRTDSGVVYASVPLPVDHQTVIQP